MGKGWANLHGHSHGRLKSLPRQCDVGVEVGIFDLCRLEKCLAARNPTCGRTLPELPCFHLDRIDVKIGNGGVVRVRHCQMFSSRASTSYGYIGAAVSRLRYIGRRLPGVLEERFDFGRRRLTVSAVSARYAVTLRASYYS